MIAFQELFQKIRSQYENGLPFVAYALPSNDEVVCLLQENDHVYTANHFSENGFVFAPFNVGDTLFLPESHIESLSASISDVKSVPFGIHSEMDISEKETYNTLLEKAISFISEGNASKIVTSRTSKFSLHNFDLKLLLERVMALYPMAFRYVWFHPESGLWCGASPEILITTKGNKFETMALAGTLLYEPDLPPQWTKKEINEQKWVVDALTDNLEKVSSILEISEVYDHKAGSLVHLRTDFSGTLKQDGKGLAALVDSLHPTPAICGTPKDVAKKFILENEDYDRSFYSGFLGPIDLETGYSQLFVNLRCMKIDDGMANLYVGGGITKDSRPEDEFLETENKLETMRQVIAPMIQPNN